MQQVQKNFEQIIIQSPNTKYVVPVRRLPKKPDDKRKHQNTKTRNQPLNSQNTMKTIAKYLPAAALGALLLIGGTSKASATTIYSQTFTGGTNPLVGTSVTTGDGIWTGANIINRNGNSTGTYGGLSLDFTPESGYVYDLTATINVTAPNGSWLGVGFLQDNNPYGFFGTKTTPTVLGTDRWQIWAGPGANYTKNSNDILIRLDTTGAQWTAAFFQGGGQMGDTYTYTSGNPTINYVGIITEGAAVGSVSAFQLTQAVPEPSTYALVVGGIATLLLIRRRVQA
ncbi:MAG: PEP-CTERM sorting domain-containing protein [Chthoniobacterales bacterium]